MTAHFQSKSNRFGNRWHDSNSVFLETLQIKKEYSWYCKKVNSRVHLCRMLSCEHYDYCKRG